MPNATIQDLMATQIGNFSLEVTFGVAVSGFEKTDVNLRALTGNGITGVDFSISGVEPVASFMLMFTLPATAEGSFEISITGMVTPEGGSTPEAVMAASVVVVYDTTTNVTATFGTVEYREGNVIAVPVTFGESVIAPKTAFTATRVTGDALTGITYVIRGEGTDFELEFTIPPDREGSFSVSANGYVLKTATSVWDNVIITPITVVYNSIVISVVDFDLPIAIPNESYDAKYAFSAVVEGIHQNNAQTVIKEVLGQFGTATAYKWIGANPPTDTEFKADIRNTDPPPPSDWAELTAPPGGHMGPWYEEPLQYLLIRYDNVDPGLEGEEFARYLDTTKEMIRNRGT